MRGYNQRVECICQNQAHVQYFWSPRIHLTKQMWPLKKVYTRVYVCDIEKWHHEYYIYFAFQYMAKCVIMPFEGEVEQIQLCLNEQEYYFRLHFQALF